MPPNPADARTQLSEKLARAVIAASRNVSGQSDRNTATELEELENQKKRVEITGFEQDISERKKYAIRFFTLSCAWLFLVAILLVLQGFGPTLHFHLGDTVILAAIGATTVNVLGILYVVANYLFPKR
jgi:hypothetical protein